MDKVILAAATSDAARTFAAELFGSRVRIDGPAVLVWDRESLLRTVGLARETPWLAIRDADMLVLNELYSRFGDPAKQLPISTAPRDGRQIMLIGPSGYVPPHHVHRETGHWTDLTRMLRPQDGWAGDWLNDADDAITDGWPAPTHWWPL